MQNYIMNHNVLYERYWRENKLLDLKKIFSYKRSNLVSYPERTLIVKKFILPNGLDDLVECLNTGSIYHYLTKNKIINHIIEDHTQYEFFFSSYINEDVSYIIILAKHNIIE